MVLMRTIDNDAVSTDELLAGATEQFEVLGSVTYATLSLIALAPQINVLGGCSTAILALLGLHSPEDLLQAVDLKGRRKVGYIVSRHRGDLTALGTQNGPISAPEGEPLEAGSLAVDVVARKNLQTPRGTTDTLSRPEEFSSALRRLELEPYRPNLFRGADE